jgi:hypothetical protein
MMRKGIDYRLVIIIILTVLLLITGYIAQKNRQDLVEQTNLVSSLNKDMVVWKDKKGITHSETQIIETRNPKDFLALKVKDRTITALQEEVKKYKNQLGKNGSVTKIKGDITIDTVYTKIIVKNNNFIWKDTISNKWLKWEYSVKKDTLNKAKVNFKLKLIYDYAIINKEKSNGWFKKPTPYSEVVNYNPYSSTISTTTYRVTNDIKKNHFKLAPYVGYGATLIDDVVKVGPQAGFGLTYNF